MEGHFRSKLPLEILIRKVLRNINFFLFSWVSSIFLCLFDNKASIFILFHKYGVINSLELSNRCFRSISDKGGTISKYFFFLLDKCFLSWAHSPIKVIMTTTFRFIRWIVCLGLIFVCVCKPNTMVRRVYLTIDEEHCSCSVDKFQTQGICNNG